MSDLCRELGLDGNLEVFSHPNFSSLIPWICDFMIPWVGGSEDLQFRGFGVLWVVGSVFWVLLWVLLWGL